MRLVLCLLILIGTGTAWGEDMNPPPWRTSPPGQGTTTMQVWEFGSDKNPAAPDLVYNKFGAPLATVVGPMAQWLPENEGHLGVWSLEDWIRLDIPNNPDPLQDKLIWLQLTFSAEEGHDPEFAGQPGLSSVELIKKVMVDDHYWHGTYQLTIHPNPAKESIYIMPRDCKLLVDEIVVDTLCIPEPASLLLLASAGLFLLRRR